MKFLTRRSKKDKSTLSQLSVQWHRRWTIVGVVFMCFGAVSLTLSIIYNSSILAFIGLGLAFWGALFLFVKPTKYVRLNVFDSTTMSSLKAIDKILNELNCQGQGVYFPPRYTEKLENVVVLVPLKRQLFMPKAEALAEGKVFLNSDWISLTPPGQGLLNLYEKELRTDFSKRDINYLSDNLPKLLVENLEILDDLEIHNQEDGTVYVKMKGSFHTHLCSQIEDYTNMCRLGCPLCSSFACALAKAMDKAVIIERNEVSEKENTTVTWYHLVEWSSS